MRTILESDLALLTEWIEGDPAHRGVLAPSFWFDPQWVSFVDELPKTATGKVQKYVLRGGRANVSKQ